MRHGKGCPHGQLPGGEAMTDTVPHPVTPTPPAAALRARMAAVRLYVVTAAEDTPQRTLEVVRAACAAGAEAVQLRRKGDAGLETLQLAERCRAVTAAAGVLFIVNDRLDVAMAAEADGVHLGQADLPLGVARRLWAGHLVGRSTHSLEQALHAQAEGADYAGVGPVFATPTKPGREPVGVQLVAEVASQLTIPWVAIGGINAQTLPEVAAAGARAVAVVRAVTSAAEPAAAVAALHRALTELRR